MKKGYIHIYTGGGKGKTTAAFGLAVRALFAGKSVFIGQFVKNLKNNEAHLDEKFDRVKIEQFGDGCIIDRDITADDLNKAADGVKRSREILTSGEYDIVILDELPVALQLGLLDKETILSLVETKRPETELIITGRDAPQELIDMADLVTEMREIKHYFRKGILSRNGIER